MKRPSNSKLSLFSLLLVLTACAEPATPAQESRSAQAAKPPAITRVSRVAVGEVFPGYVYKDLNPASGTGGRVNLGEVIGKKPVIFLYWIPGNARAERLFEDIRKVVEEAGANKAAFYGIVKQRPGMEAPQIAEKVRDLKLSVPILDDEEFRLGQQLSVQAVPSLAILDAEGRLRLANAANLKQVLEYNMDVEAALRRVVSKGTLGNYGILPRYFPVDELIGKKCPDFEAPMVGDGAMRKWSSVLDPKRINVLVFWSVDCPHCKKSLPEINDWLKQHPQGVNLVAAASVPDDVTRTRTEEYCRLNSFVFPTFVDRNMQIGELFQVTSTPTVLIIRPDGVVDSVLHGEADFAAAFESKRKELLVGGGPKS